MFELSTENGEITHRDASSQDLPLCLTQQQENDADDAEQRQ
jgi:hypothetical protein